MKLIAERVIQQVLQLECVDGNATLPFPTFCVDQEIAWFRTFYRNHILRRLLTDWDLIRAKSTSFALNYSKYKHMEYLEQRIEDRNRMKDGELIPSPSPNNLVLHTQLHLELENQIKERQESGIQLVRRRVPFDLILKYLETTRRQASYKDVCAVLKETGLSLNPFATGIPPMSRVIVPQIRTAPLSFPSPYLTALTEIIHRRIANIRTLDDYDVFRLPLKALLRGFAGPTDYFSSAESQHGDSMTDRKKNAEEKLESHAQNEPKKLAHPLSQEQNNKETGEKQDERLIEKEFLAICDDDQNSSFKKKLEDAGSEMYHPDVLLPEISLPFETELSLEAQKNIPKHIWDIHP